MFADVQRERGLSHAGSAGDDDQIARLKARCLRIEIGEAARHAGHVRRIRALEQFLNAFDHAGQQRLNLDEALAAARALLGDLKNLGLGFVEYLLGVFAGRIQRTGCNLVACGHKPAQHRTLTHQLGIAANIGGRRRVLRQRIQIDEPARLFGPPGIAQRLEHRDRVGRLAGIDETADRREDVLMVLPIKIVGAD